MLMVHYQRLGTFVGLHFYCKDHGYACAARRIKCVLVDTYCLLIVPLKILYCDDPLAGIVLGKFTLKQQVPKEKSYSY